MAFVVLTLAATAVVLVAVAIRRAMPESGFAPLLEPAPAAE